MQEIVLILSSLAGVATAAEYQKTKINYLVLVPVRTLKVKSVP
jgi:hypothetical protein